eukprot:CAMPEP_0201578002 /NCGR_PEP_ID=MMETSP0190_2-20130828/24625_1 /ASSEMBLY_ACC=CAM_ASM_000263 /TAXON_ID=37353 /ORGANISM="Rosalina sp." /LENGTH=515 /DNA_ID=CAMNT_0048010661 /DNA_START=29 /DNA_END=1576 /DNA_ORIENTATION=+
MGCLSSSEDSYDDDPVSAKAEVTTPTTQARISGKMDPELKFQEFPSTSPPESPDDMIPSDTYGASSQDRSKNVSFSPKLAHLSQMVDLNTTIPEAASIEDIIIPQKTIEETQVYDDDFDDANDEYSMTHDKFNKELTIYEITEDMSSNIEQLIEDKIQELQSNTSYMMIESAFHTLPGIKNGKTKTNQDSYFIFDSFGSTSNISNLSQVLQLYGVCDGHGPSGHNVSQYCAKYLPQLLIKDRQRILTTLCKPGYALIKAFEELEEQLEREKKNGELKFDMSASGTTISCGLRVGNYLYLANLGDSRAVMGKYDIMSDNKETQTFSKIKVRSDQLTVDHDPKNQNEAERINQSKKGKLLVEEDGTSRIQINLVDDKLAKPRQSVVQLKQTYGVDALKQLNAVSASVSRSIGDKLAHDYGGVISKPDVIIHKLNGEDLFVMWASDGIWTVIDNEDVTRIIGNKLKLVANEKEYSDFQKITNKIVKEAHIVWQDEFDDYVDDITAVIARIGTKKLYES